MVLGLLLLLCPLALAGVTLLVENEPSCNGGFASEVAAIVRGIDSPAVRALWDPGNEAYGGREAFPAGYEQMKDVLAHVHLKDAYIGPDGKPRCVPMGSGNVAVIPQLRALKAAGYDTTLVFDASPADAKKAMDAFAEKSTGADTALIYVGGHGIQHKRIVYWMMGDYPDRDAKYLPDHAFAIDDIAKAARARDINLVLYASCRDDPFAN